MTNQEIVARQRRWRQLDARSKAIVSELRTDDREALGKAAAEIIEWLLNRIAALRNDLNQEIRESQRSARDAYIQGQEDEQDQSRY